MSCDHNNIYIKSVTDHEGEWHVLRCAKCLTVYKKLLRLA